MFSRHLRILLNVHVQLSRLRFHSAAITRQVNLKTVTNNQQKIIKSLKQSNAISPAVYQSKKYSNLPSQISEYESDDEDDEVAAKKDGNTLRVTENLFAYSVLQKSGKIKTIVPRLISDEDVPEDVVAKILEKDHENSSPAEVLEDFRLLSYHRNRQGTGILTPEEHSNIFRTLKKYLNDFSDEELWNLLQYIEMWYPMRLLTKEPLLIELEEAIDQECIQRFNVWSTDDKLKTCDLWYRLRQSRQSHFVGKCMKRIGSKTGKMTAENYLHYMFLINITRKPDINMYELEYRLEKFVSKFNGDELGIISMGFFKTKTPIRNPSLLDNIIDTCIRDINEMGEISLSAIMKITRYSLGLNALGKFKKLLFAYQPRIKTASASSLVHTAHAAGTVLVYEKEIINEILDRFMPCIPTARLKDLERMLFSLVIFNYPKESPHYNLIIEELNNPRRKTEIKKFPLCLATSLMYLSQANIYPLDLISKLLSPKYLKEVYNNNAYKIGRECLVVDVGLRIEVPEYKGPFLPERVINYLCKKYSASILNIEDRSEKIQSFQKFIFELVNLLKEILGSKDYMIEQLLPHLQRADIIMCIDKQNNVVSPDPYFPKFNAASIKYAPKEPADSRWLALLLASHNHTFRGTIEPCGSLNAKIRQLKKIGYHPIVITHNSWNNKTKTLEAKSHYLKELLLHHGVNIRSTS